MADQAKAEPKPETVKVTVGAGRTVYHDGEIYMAGQQFEPPKADAEMLMKHGFLENPNAEPAPLPQGARVGLVASERR